MKTRLFVLILFCALGLRTASAQSVSPHGSYGVLLNLWPQSGSKAGAILGVFNFDGAGNITGSYTLLGANVARTVTGSLTGTYSGNSDGTASADIILDIAPGAEFTAAIVTTDGGSGLLIGLTGGTGLDTGATITGTGRIQSAQGAPPTGSYGYVLNQWPDSVSGAIAVMGVINLDGAGNVNGSYTLVGAGAGGMAGTFTGSYTTSSNGSVVATINPGGPPFTLSMVVTDVGLQMLVSGGPIFGNGTGTVVSGTARLQ